MKTDIEYRIEQFMNEYCARGPSYRCRINMLYDSYLRWCTFKMIPKVNEPCFSKTLCSFPGIARGRELDGANNVFFYFGITSKEFLNSDKK